MKLLKKTFIPTGHPFLRAETNAISRINYNFG